MKQERQILTSNKNFITCTNQSKIINFNNFSNSSKNTIDCLIILNCKSDIKLLTTAINSCQNIIIADGGANHFYQTSHRDCDKVKYIIGDLDSINPQIKEYYQKSKTNVKLLKIIDQDYTDFQKCLQKANQLGYKSCICLGAFGGRLDHTLLSIHLLKKYGVKYPEMELILVGDSNLMLLIQPNKENIIKVSNLIQRKGCGLITFNKVSHIQTKGFKWNLGAKYDYHCLEWGQFISTSNQIAEEQVNIVSPTQLVFVCGLRESSEGV